MIIRKATIKDIQNLIPVFLEYELAKIGCLDPKYRVIRQKKKPVMKNIRKALIEDLHVKNSLFLVAEENNVIVGYIYGIICNDNHTLFAPPKTGDLSEMVVLKKFQGRGISSKLWHALESWFKKHRCVHITLSVYANNDAQEIYKNWGFDKYYYRMIKKL